MGMEYIPTFFGYRQSLSSLTDEQFGRVVRAALAYAEEGIIPELDPLESLAFAVMRGDIDRAKVKYEAIAERNRINGAKGGRPKNPENPVGYLGTQKNPENPVEPKKPIQDNTKQDNTKQNNTNESVDTAPAQKKTRKTFSPPTVEDVRAYCAENGLNTIDPEGFVDYYAANGWKVGNQPMKDWKATLRNWSRRDRERGITSKPAAKVQPAETSFETDSFFEASLARSYHNYSDQGGGQE